MSSTRKRPEKPKRDGTVEYHLSKGANVEYTGAGSQLLNSFRDFARDVR